MGLTIYVSKLTEETRTVFLAAENNKLFEVPLGRDYLFKAEIHLTEAEEVTNITHNLAPMARQAGLYDALWCCDEVGRAQDLVTVLEEGVTRLLEEPDYFKVFNPPNGWGRYEHLLDLAERMLDLCRDFPDAVFTVCK